MGKDYRVLTTWHRHRKTRRLIALLGYEGPFRLLALWAFAAEMRPSGIFEGLTDADLADECGWSGDPAQLIESLLTSGWLDRRADGALRIHDWEEWNAYVVHGPERSEVARENAIRRWEKHRAKKGKSTQDANRNAKGNANGNTGSNATGNANRNAKGNAPDPVPAPDPDPDPSSSPPARAEHPAAPASSPDAPTPGGIAAVRAVIDRANRRGSPRSPQRDGFQTLGALAGKPPAPAPERPAANGRLDTSGPARAWADLAITNLRAQVAEFNPDLASRLSEATPVGRQANGEALVLLPDDLHRELGAWLDAQGLTHIARQFAARFRSTANEPPTVEATPEADQTAEWRP